ncbi:MAG: homing endonuclease associated repeat-containing protein, partial [Candidatus Acidiferrum sp.]
MPDKQEIVSIIAKIAKKLGRAPSEKEFNSLSDLSSYYVLQRFRSWNDAVRAARLRPYSLNIRPKEHALLEDWGKAVRRHRGVPPRRVYAREGKYNPATLEKRFGPWSRLPEAFRNFARRKPAWTDVVALLPGRLPRGRA